MQKSEFLYFPTSFRLDPKKEGKYKYFQQNKYFKAYTTETATPSYTLLSAGIGGNIKAFDKPNFMSIYVSAENLTNASCQSHLSRLKYAPQNMLTGRTGVYNMGRNLSIKVIFNL